MQTYEPAGPGMIVCESGGTYVLSADAKKVEEELALAKETILLLESEVKVKCRDCNRHGAFKENVKLREERDRLDGDNFKLRGENSDLKRRTNTGAKIYNDLLNDAQRLLEERDRLREKYDELDTDYQKDVDIFNEATMAYDKQIAILTAEVAGMREVGHDMLSLICELCKRVNPHHRSCTSCADTDLYKQALGKEAM